MDGFSSFKAPSSAYHRNSIAVSPERQFLLAVERSDISTVKSYLDKARAVHFDVNCRDSLGRNAILIAIDNEHIELLALLLQYDLDLTNALLHAIDEEHLEAVEMIIAAQSTRAVEKETGDCTNSATSSFTPDITPIVLASHKDNYEIIKLLLERGDNIPKPHDLRCACQYCIDSQKLDSLQHSKSRINSYQALSSPCLIALSSKDPILTAFELSWELVRLGQQENEFASVYDNLSRRCSDFATALLEQTRESSELAILLNHSSQPNMNIHDIADCWSVSNHSLTRLKLAIKYNQKSFVANPHCQQLLASLWYDGLPGFRRRPFIYKMAIILGLNLMFPVLSAVYLVFPHSRLGGLMRKPFIKFICHSSSYLMFLFLLILASLRIEFINSEVVESRSNAPTVIEWLLIIYIGGFIWQEIKELWNAGLKCYIMDMWNLLDFATNALYVATISLRAVAYYKFNHTSNVTEEQRPKWDSYDPILISECLFAAANIFSTLKLVYIFTMNPHLGPLQISLGRMLNDILKFFCIYMLVLIAFACGLNQLLWFYAKKRKEICSESSYRFFLPSEKTPQSELHTYCATRGKYFTNLFEIVQSLYWSTYGLIDLTNLNLEYPHEFTEFVGKLMFGAYSAITLVVLLNMLIAMMNTSYQVIVEKADVEWKFARSKLWISYFEDGNTLPAPFNIIVSPKTIFYCTRWFHLNWFCKSRGRKNKWQSIKKIASRVSEMEKRYQNVMENLVMRYLMSRQKSEDKQEVTEDDINEIKGDISAFRFELLDILRNNGMQIPKLITTPTTSKKNKKKGSKKSFCRFGRQMTDDLIQNSDTKVPQYNTSEYSNSVPKNDVTEMTAPKILSPPKRGYRPRKSFSLDEQPSVSFDLKPMFIEACHSSVKEKKESYMNKFQFNKSVFKSAFNRMPNVSLESPEIESNQTVESNNERTKRSNLSSNGKSEFVANSREMPSVLREVNKPEKRVDLV